MNIEVTWEIRDQIIKQTLLEDYKILMTDINRLQDIQEREQYEQEDLLANIRFINAIETLMYYYFPASEAEKIVNQKA